jgi:hypothetical protein
MASPSSEPEVGYRSHATDLLCEDIDAEIKSVIDDAKEIVTFIKAHRKKVKAAYKRIAKQKGGTMPKLFPDTRFAYADKMLEHLLVKTTSISQSCKLSFRSPAGLLILAVGSQAVVGEVLKRERQTPTSFAKLRLLESSHRMCLAEAENRMAEAENRMAASSTTLTLTRIRLNMVEYIFNLINKVKYSILHIENQDMHIRGTKSTSTSLCIHS